MPGAGFLGKNVMAGEGKCARISPSPVEVGEDGNAIVEFVGVMVVIIIPALVLLTGLATTTMAQLALNDAARQSARAYVRAQSASAAYSAGGSACPSGMGEPRDTEPASTFHVAPGLA